MPVDETNSRAWVEIASSGRYLSRLLGSVGDPAQGSRFNEADGLYRYDKVSDRARAHLVTPRAGDDTKSTSVPPPTSTSWPCHDRRPPRPRLQCVRVPQVLPEPRELAQLSIGLDTPGTYRFVLGWPAVTSWRSISTRATRIGAAGGELPFGCRTTWQRNVTTPAAKAAQPATPTPPSAKSTTLRCIWSAPQT